MGLVWVSRAGREECCHSLPQHRGLEEKRRSRHTLFFAKFDAINVA